MNTRNASVLILAAALSASALSPLFASTKEDIPVAYSVRTLISTSNGDMKVQRGMTRGDVSFAMRYKDREQLTPDVWVYTGYHANNSNTANSQGCETVVITFSNDRVSDLQLVNKPAFAAIAATLKPDSPARNIASR
jgi:hypothetical protein